MQEKTFSVVTVSKRTGWEEMATATIARQTEQPDRWIIVSSDMKTTFPKLMMPSVFCPTVVLQEPKPTRASNLSASDNHGLREVDTDYVIFYQDFIELPPDCFEKLLALADENTFVGTVTKNPEGVKEDPRYLGVDCPRPCLPDEWETNVALAPMKAIRELGGFDEEYDDGFAWDNVNIADRAAMLGYKFILDESNRPQLLPHPPAHNGEIEPNGERHARIMREIREGKRPIKCNYVV